MAIIISKKNILSYLYNIPSLDYFFYHHTIPIIYYLQSQMTIAIENIDLFEYPINPHLFPVGFLYY